MYKSEAMNFYHVLLSNTSPNVFPKNNASSFSTLIENPYILNGNWEVALLKAQYSNCIYTFTHGDVISVKKKVANIFETKKPMLMYCTPQAMGPMKEILNKFIAEVNIKFDKILKLRGIRDGKYLEWKVLSDTYIVAISKNLREQLRRNDVMTAHDKHITNYYPIYDEIVIKKNDFLLAIPTSAAVKDFPIKESNEALSAQDLCTRVNSKLTMDGQQLGTLKLDHKHIVYETTQPEKSKYIVIFNKEFHEATGHMSAGYWAAKDYRLWGHDLPNHFKSKFHVYIFSTEGIPEFHYNQPSIPLDLQQQLFQEPATLTDFLNKKCSEHDVRFSIDDKKLLSMEIMKDHMSVSFTDDLRDILGFDKNEYSNKGTYKANNEVVFDRHIRYLFVYSNLGDMVRVGDTEAPLLGVIPFTRKQCKNITEKIFKSPMYIRVISNNIGQINIGIYDEAGKLVPFHRDAMTSLRLHFRQFT